MYNPEYLGPCVGIIELTCILKVARYDVFVVTFPGYSIRSPLTVIHTQIVYSLYGCTSTTMCDYVIVRPTGILLRATKRIVFVPFHFPWQYFC